MDDTSPRYGDQRRLRSRRAFLRMVAAGTAVCVAPLAACAGRTISGKLGAEPDRVRVDEPFVVRLEGLTPGQSVTLRARLADGEGQEWRSEATFEADPGGRVDTSEQAPLEVSYEARDPMGLVWSALGSGGLYVPLLRPGPVTVTAEVRGVGASIEVERYLLTDEVEEAEVRERGLVGRFFRPAGDEAVPGVLVMGGSEGGIAPYVAREAALLASHGYAGLALAYFDGRGPGADGLPDRLANIPSEYFGRAIEWLGGQEAVRPDKLGVLGHSRGGELALILGAYYQEMKAVVSWVGSGVVAPSLGGDEPAWTYRSEPLPRLPFLADPSELRQEDLERAEIPVERTDGPVLLIAAENDELWPSARLSRIAAERLERYGRDHPDELVIYPGAGHLIQPPYLPTTAGVGRFGGDPRSNAAAGEDSWRRTLRLLDEQLKG